MTRNPQEDAGESHRLPIDRQDFGISTSEVGGFPFSGSGAGSAECSLVFICVRYLGQVWPIFFIQRRGDVIARLRYLVCSI